MADTTTTQEPKLTEGQEDTVSFTQEELDEFNAGWDEDESGGAKKPEVQDAAVAETEDESESADEPQPADPPPAEKTAAMELEELGRTLKEKPAAQPATAPVATQTAQPGPATATAPAASAQPPASAEPELTAEQREALEENPWLKGVLETYTAATLKKAIASGEVIPAAKLDERLAQYEKRMAEAEHRIYVEDFKNEVSALSGVDVRAAERDPAFQSYIGGNEIARTVLQNGLDSGNAANVAKVVRAFAEHKQAEANRLADEKRKAEHSRKASLHASTIGGQKGANAGAKPRPKSGGTFDEGFDSEE